LSTPARGHSHGGVEARVLSPAREPPPAAARLASLDAFRGATIAAMVLVNNPGSWAHVYWPLAHAPWHGWTPTDLIFN
jgi:predicted acyltransferase